MARHTIWLVNTEAVRGEGAEPLKEWLRIDAEAGKVTHREVDQLRCLLWCSGAGEWSMEIDGGQREIELVLDPAQRAAGARRKLLSYWAEDAPDSECIFETFKGRRFRFAPYEPAWLKGSALEHARRFLRVLEPGESTDGLGKVKIAKQLPPAAEREARACLFAMPLVRDEGKTADALGSAPPGDGWIFTPPYRNPPPEEPEDRFYSQAWTDLRRHAFGKLIRTRVEFAEWPPLLRLCAVADNMGFRDWLQEGGRLRIHPTEPQTLKVEYPAANAMAAARAEPWRDIVGDASTVPWRQQVLASERKHLSEAAGSGGWQSVGVEALPDSAEPSPDNPLPMRGVDLSWWEAGWDITDCQAFPIAARTMPPVATGREERPLFAFLQYYFSDLAPALKDSASEFMFWRELQLWERRSRWEWGKCLFLPGLQSFRSESEALGENPSQGSLADGVAFLMDWMVAAATGRAEVGQWLDDKTSDIVARLESIAGGIRVENRPGKGWRIHLARQRRRRVVALLLPPHRIAPEPFRFDESRLGQASFG